MTLEAIKPHPFPWFDYSNYTFSMGLKAGTLTLLAGHTASQYDPDTREIVIHGGIADQARVAYAKVRAIMEAGGLGLTNVVRVAEYVTVDGIDAYAEAAGVREEILGPLRPAVSTIVVNSLVRPHALIEIEVAAAPSSESPSARPEWPPAWAESRATDGVIYLSSILPLDNRGEVAYPGDLIAQTRVIFDRAARILEPLGLGMSNVVKTVDYITPAALSDYKETRHVRRERLAPLYPAATGIIMRRLARPDAMIQVEFIASRHQRVAVNPGWPRYAHLTYSPGVRAGDLLFIAGHAAVDSGSGRAMHPGDIVGQAECAYGNIMSVIAAAGGGPQNLAHTVEYVTPAGHRRSREISGVRSRMMRVPYPTATGIVCESLLRPEFLIEIDSLAVL